MKTLFATATMAVLLASASHVSAQTMERRSEPLAIDAFAQSPLPPRASRRVVERPIARAHSTNPAHDAYDSQGNYIGSDPDPFIRNDLMRAPPNRGGD